MLGPALLLESDPAIAGQVIADYGTRIELEGVPVDSRVEFGAAVARESTSVGST